MMKCRALWSVVLLGGLMTALPSTQHACGQTTTVYYPPAFGTTNYGPRAVYYPAYPVYRPTFLQAFFGPLSGYNYYNSYPAYSYPAPSYRTRVRASYYVPTVVRYAPVTSCPAACTPCETSASPGGNAAKSAVGKSKTYSEQKPPLPRAKSKSSGKEHSATGVKKPDGVPSGDSPFRPTHPLKKSGASPAFPGSGTSDTGNPRRIEARKLTPPLVIQQRKSKRPPLTEPAEDKTDPFGRKAAQPGTVDKNKPKQPGTTSPGKKTTGSGATGIKSTTKVRSLHLDGHVAWRPVSRRTRLSVRPLRFGTSMIDRAYRSNRGWVPVLSGDRVAGP